MQNIFEESKNKTRVLVLSSQPSVAQLLLEVLQFHDKDFDFYLEDGSFKNSDTDFVIFETWSFNSENYPRKFCILIFLYKC